MSESQTYLSLLLKGEVPVTDIDDFVEKWHEEKGAKTLHDYLGMTEEEYSLWLQNPDMLGAICAARRKRQPLVQAVKDSTRELRLAGKPDDSAKLRSLELWLSQREAVD